MNLPQLQNCIKKDPSAYEEEFQIQFRHYESILQILVFNPAYFDRELESLVMFLAHTCPYYKKNVEKFPEQLIYLLRNYSTGLHRASRMACCRALVVLRSKSFLDLKDLLPLFFELASCQDKQLRSYLTQNIVSDIKSMNKRSRNEKVNRELQRYMFAALKNEQQDIAAKMSLEIMKELYKKNIWTNKELVNQISQACLSRSSKILIPALQFFIGSEDTGVSDAEDDTSEDEGDVAKRPPVATKPNFTAIHVINDPQTFCEKLFSHLEATGERFEVKLMMMNLISRLIGAHDLLVLNFYALVTKYLHPHQPDVTRILQYAAQSTHTEIPPNELEPMVRAVADNFISERNSTEAITVGLNSIREICARNPHVIGEDLLQDLVQYQKYKNKNVSIAAKSLVNLYRAKNPQLLTRKDRGRPNTQSEVESDVEFDVDSNSDMDLDDDDCYDDDDDDDNSDDNQEIEGTRNIEEVVKLADIERIYKRPKNDKESRLATVLEGRKGREKFGPKKEKTDVRRNKAFGMIKHKIKRRKSKKSFHEKQQKRKQFKKR